MDTLLLLLNTALLARLIVVTRQPRTVPGGKPTTPGPRTILDLEAALRDLALENSDIGPALSSAVLARLAKVDKVERLYNPEGLSNDIAQLVAEHRAAEPGTASLFIDALREIGPVHRAELPA